MERRRFLGLGGASVLAFSALGSRAAAQYRPELELFSDAYRAAQRAGRPLLVVVRVTSGTGMNSTRSVALGYALDGCDPECRAELAIAELACASMETIRQLVPQVGDGEPAAILIEPHELPARVARIEESHVANPQDPWAIDRVEYASWLGARLRELLGVGDPILLARRAAIARAAVGEAAAASIEAAIANGSVSPAQVALAPALVLSYVRSHPRRADLITALGDLVQRRWVDDAPPGGEWDTPPACFYCGMARVSRSGRYFLFYYGRW